jgi:leucyl-tRNA synthetase
MAVPGHDQRDFDFATRFGLPIRRVVLGPDQSPEAPLAEAYDGDGVLVNSGAYDGLPAAEGAARLTADLAARGLGHPTVQYRLRDWLVSRQRYWGAPIPIVHCERCGEVPVPERDLPVLLPDDVDFLPRGVPPLATSESFMTTSCPGCGGPARRDPDTMDTFVDSSWYFLRYVSPHEEEAPFRREVADRWLPVDAYVGGADHAYGHLIFSRFMTKVLCDQGLLGFDEPFARLVHQGMITRGGEKMSKSKGNVVNPEEYLRRYGTDTLRMYVMFGFAFEDGGDWTDQGIEAVHRYLQRVVRLVDAAGEGRSPAGDAPADAPPLAPAEAEARGRDLLAVTHQSIKGCSEDTERFHFNTAISRLMELTNALYAYVGRNSVGLEDPRYRESIHHLVVMLSPFAPHLGEELWQRIGGEGHVFDQPWPAWREEALRRALVTVVIQVNGKIRERLEVPAVRPENELVELALACGRIPEWLGGRPLRKAVVVPDKLVNLVV